MVSHIFTALFESSAAAREAVTGLIEAGIATDDISIATRYSGTETVFGLATFALPGDGPFAWNPYTNIYPAAVGGSFAHAFVTTIPEDEVSSLFEGMGLPAEQASDCADVLHRGGSVLQINPSEATIPSEAIENVLQALGARYFSNPQAEQT